MKGHLNMLIIDTKMDTLEHFEPHGKRFLGKTDKVKINEKMEKTLRKLSKDLELDFIPAYKVCPFEEGFQALESIEKESDIKIKFENNGKPIKMKQDGLCALWSFLYLDLRLSNPNLDPSSIMRDSIFHSVPESDLQFEKNKISLRQYNSI